MKYEAPRQFAWFVPPNEQYPKGKFHRSNTAVHTSEKMQAAAEYHKEHACYESVFCFPGWTGGRLDAAKAKSAIIDRVYFDFDCKEDPLRAIRDAGKIAEYVGHSTNWFSGMKGAGMLIHCEPVDLIPDLKGAVLNRFALVVQDTFSEVTTLDMAVTGDVNRVHRIIDSVHPGTGLHAIGLTSDEMQTLPLGEIEFMAQQARGLVQQPKRSMVITERLQHIEVVIIKERLQKLVDSDVLSSTNAHHMGESLWERESKLEVWDFIKRVESEVHRIQMKKLANMPKTSGGRTPEETWLMKVVELFKIAGRAANIQPEGSRISTSGSEQEARAHLVKLANDCGWAFNQICEMFDGADDYNQRVTEGQIKSLLRS